MKRAVQYTLLIWVCMLLPACGFSVTSHSESGSSESGPPMPTVKIDGKEITYEEGSYCWHHDGQGICADTAGAVGLTKDKHPFSIDGGSQGQIKYEEPPTEIFIRILKDGVQKERIVNKSEFTLPDEPGIYVIDVFSRWDEKGDQTIAFKIEVQKK